MLELADMHIEHRKLAIEAGEAQRRAHDFEQRYLKLQDKVLELWKKVHPDQTLMYDHHVLPDGRMAHVQQGAVTFWEVTKL